MNISDLHGIDISSWQAGMPSSALNSVDFAILKISEGTGWKDPQFEIFYNAATIPLGAYVYSHAITEDDAIEEATYALQLIDGRELPLGIYIDVEEQKQLALRDSVLTSVVKAFCETIKDGGYCAGAYGSAGNLWSKVGPSYLGDDVLVWVAAWSNSAPKFGDLWQYTDHASVNGHNGNVDGDKALSERFADLILGNTPATEPDDPEPSPDPAPAPEQPAEDEKATFSLLGVPVLRKGDTGDAVKAMQGELLALGYSCGGKKSWCGHEKADGIFGNVTEESVRSFQRSNNLPDDGIVGQKTRAALLGI